MLRFRPICIFIAIGFSLSLSACGGGGGGGSSSNSEPTPATATFPVAQAYASQVINGFHTNFTISGKTNGANFTGTGTLTVSPAVAANFEGQAAMSNTSTLTASITANGTTVPVNSSDTLYVDSNYHDLGDIDQDGTYTVVTSYTPLPTAAHVHDTGALSSSTSYADQNKMTVVGANTSTYAIEPDSATSVIFDIIEKNYDSTNALTETIHERYRVTAAGAVSFYSADYQSADGADTEHIVPQ